MEMNKRLQVEHGITEMITGMDLVEMQLRIAFGERLKFKQKAIKPNGFAMEARVYAEDPRTFFPSAGTITHLTEPTRSRHVRIDSFIYSGYEVGIHYDPLLAKLMCWGETREEARRNLLDALGEYNIEGISTNIPLLIDVLSSEDFISGKYDTGMITNLLKELSHVVQSTDESSASDEKEIAAAIAVVTLAYRDNRENKAIDREQAGASSWRIYGRTLQISSRFMERSGWR